MSRHIISAFRSQMQLRPAVRFTLQELGHRMNDKGYGRCSLTFLAEATGWAKSTLQLHIAEAIEAGVLRKQCFKLGRRWAINLYICLVAVRQHAYPAHTRSIPAVGRNLPSHKTGEEKSLSLREEIRRQQWALHNLAMPGEAREVCTQELARLESLLKC